MRIVSSSEPETTNFPSGDNPTDVISPLWPTRTLITAGQSLSCPERMHRVCGKSQRKCCATLDLHGDHGSADKYMCGALCEIGVAKLTANLAASAANAAKSGSAVCIGN